jgi:hypothetical protein
MMYLFSVAVLISQLGVSRADTCAAFTPAAGPAVPLDYCIEYTEDSGALTSLMYYCDGGVAYVGYGYSETSCGGAPGFSLPIDSSMGSADCDADPCDTVIINSCSDSDCSVDCASTPALLDQCSPRTDETGQQSGSTQLYCGSGGLTYAEYSDDACTDETLALPYETVAQLTVGGEGGCLTFDTDCEATDDGGDDDTSDYVDCPTGAVYAVLEGADGDFEAPYIPLGLCNKYGNVQSLMSKCNDDGVATYNIYLGDGCSGDPFMSDVLDLSDDSENSTDTTTFRTECDADVDCTFARFTILPYDEESGECAGADGAIEQTVFVGECVDNGTVSFSMSCDDTSVTRSVYSSLDCTGDAVEEADMTLELGGDERCPGEVVDCYMTEPSFAPGGNSAASKMMVQVAMVLAVVVGLMMA